MELAARGARGEYPEHSAGHGPRPELRTTTGVPTASERCAPPLLLAITTAASASSPASRQMHVSRLLTQIFAALRRRMTAED